MSAHLVNGEVGRYFRHTIVEHDSIGDAGHAYRQRFGANTLGDGWYSFDTHGVHFIALVNTLHMAQLGHLGTDQIDFVRKDVTGLSADTPIVVFSHIPLFAMYPAWGWGTDDAIKVLGLLRRFSSVTCLNGHVHQMLKKVEGKATFHTASAFNGESRCSKFCPPSTLR